MAFKDIDQQLIEECCKDILDIDKIKTLIANGANINAFDEKYEQALYEEVLEFYIFEGRERRLDLSNLYKITNLFIENDLILNHKPEDRDYFLPDRFRFLPPEKICIDTFKALLENGQSSFDELEIVMTNASGDLHMGIFYFFEQTQFYSEEDSARFFLELIYWACAYKVKLFPEKCSKDILDFNWFDRDKNKVELIRENRSTSVCVENLESHKRVEIDGWTTKY